MTLRGLIFDFDGTLADTIALCCDAFRHATRDRLGREYSDAEIIALFGPNEEGIFQQIVASCWEDCLADFIDYYGREHEAMVQLFPGVEQMLDTLAERSIPVAIVTGKGVQSAEISVRALRLERHFDIIETGSAAGSIKPEAIRRIVAGWNVDPGQVAYVGDAVNDIVEARCAGVIPLAAAWAETANRSELARQEPEALFTSPTDLIEWIRHNTNG